MAAFAFMDHIGSSSVSVLRRNRQHLAQLRKNKHHAKDLQNDFNVHGETSFVFEIVEFCVREETGCRETAAIEAHKATDVSHGYNTRSFAYLRTGRPKKAASIRTSVLAISITPDRRKRILKIAKRRKLSVSEAIGRLIEQAD